MKMGENIVLCILTSKKTMSDVVMHKAGINEDGDACYWVDKDFSDVEPYTGDEDL